MATTPRKPRVKKVVKTVAANSITHDSDSLDYAPGSASEIVFNFAYDHYRKAYTSDGEMIVYDRHKNQMLKLTDEAKHVMEIVHGYEIIEAYY